MARKSRTPNFSDTLENLRTQGFEVAPYPGVAGGMMVSKYGAAAVLVAGESSSLRFAVGPGAAIGGEVARLVDRGFQKFIKSSHYEAPATADQLHAIHNFSEELKLVTGSISYYNESLGTTSDMYHYDRLKGREVTGASEDESH